MSNVMLGKTDASTASLLYFDPKIGKFERKRVFFEKRCGVVLQGGWCVVYVWKLTCFHSLVFQVPNPCHWHKNQEEKGATMRALLLWLVVLHIPNTTTLKNGPKNKNQFQKTL